MDGFADLHAHVIPGIDDGPPTIEETVELVRAAAAAGTTHLAATPHLRGDFPDVHPTEIAERLDEVHEAIAEAGVEVELVAGGEVGLAWALDATPDQLKLVSYGQRGTDILIETPTAGFIGVDAALFELRRDGYRVVLAHPERSITGDSDFERLERLAAGGVLLQINAESFRSRSRERRRFVRRLAVDGLASVIASDGHRAAEFRPITVLADGVAELTKLVGEERAAWMATGVPLAVLTGDRLPPEPPVQTRRRLLGRR